MMRYSTVMLVYDVGGLQKGSILVRPSDVPILPGETGVIDAVAVAGEVIIEWNAVMLVTSLESYLQDALTEAATRFPRLMESSEQKATYAETTNAESIEHLAGLLRSRWARAFLERGGPAKWQQKLEKLGARSFDVKTGEILEELWGLRHLIVHNAGVVTNDFVRHHPSTSHKVGSQLKLSRQDLKRFIEPLTNFVDVADTLLSSIGSDRLVE